ncbi:MAG: MBL fold metallo-hydrolase [Leptolyngbya sp.]|nr:MBL fold metallo-hydrolase [Candidatus Melainabacteria bacterium]
MSLTYLGHSAVRFDVSGVNVYVDPYFKEPVDWTKLPKGDLILFSHGHFDHGVQMVSQLYEAWQCKIAAPRNLIRWIQRKHRKRIPVDALIAIDHHETITFGPITIRAIPAHHPINRLGKTILALNARSRAPGKPVNGYYFEGFYHAGDTIYTPLISESLKGFPVHTACLPIGGKYAVASPDEALRIAEEIGAKRVVPLHFQALVERVPFRYQSSDLVKHANSTGTHIEICALAIGQLLEIDVKSKS